MMQDRIGPNRAVLPLPRVLAQGLFAGTGLAAAAAVLAWVLLSKAPQSPQGLARVAERSIICVELAILFAWSGLALWTAFTNKKGPTNAVEKWLASVGDPRTFFYFGLAVHVIVLLVHAVTAHDERLLDVVLPMSYGAGALLSGVLALSGLIAASKIPAEGFELRAIGLLHTAADGMKMFFKEDFVPRNGDKLLHTLAPMLALFPPLVVLAVVPFGDVVCLKTTDNGHLLFSNLLPSLVSRAGICMDGAQYADGSFSKAVGMQVADLNIGILFIFAITGTGVVGTALAGWASDNKYSLLGGLRGASQMISYEVTLGLTAVGAFMTYNTLRLDDMVRWQGDNAWGIFVQPLAFFLFFAAATAESKRIPFDLPEGESEIVGYFTEYSGMKFGMFYFAEYVEVVTSSALIVTLFLGGWQLPFLHRDGLTLAFGDTVILRYAMTHLSVTVIQILAFFGKTLLMCLVQALVRWTLPRFRYDQLMRLGWRSLLPISIVNIAITGVVLLALQQTSPAVQDLMKLLGDVTQGIIALASIVGIIALVRFLLKPAKKERTVLSTSAQLAAEHGGTRTSPMQA